MRYIALAMTARSFAFRKTTAIGISLLLASAAAGQQSEPEPVSAMLAALASDIAAGKADALQQFWTKAEEQHTPIIEPIAGDEKHVLATFVWKGDDSAKDVVLMAQPNGIARLRDPRSHLAPLQGTNIWYRTERIPADAEFTYAFSVNPPADARGGSLRSTLHSDPLNPLQDRILTGPIRSIARMPAVTPNPWLKESVTSEQVHEHTIHSAVLQNNADQKVRVYTTPGQVKEPNLLILLDAQTYTQSVPTPSILNNLYAAHKIGPTVAVFLDEGAGDSWLTNMYFNDAFINFVADEVIPWVQREYRFKVSPARTVIGGDSIAGSTSIYAALRRPDRFGKVLSQSGSLWLNNRDADGGEPEWLARQLTKMPKSNTYFCIEVGTMEFVPNEADRMFKPFIPAMTSLLASNRHFRDLLQAKGYRFHYFELNGDHEPVQWRRALPEALSAVLTEP